MVLMNVSQALVNVSRLIQSDTILPGRRIVVGAR
jgi:hypothetical protein